jgi:hypothetical protein
VYKVSIECNNSTHNTNVFDLFRWLRVSTHYEPTSGIDTNTQQENIITATYKEQFFTS